MTSAIAKNAARDLNFFFVLIAWPEKNQQVPGEFLDSAGDAKECTIVARED